MPKRRKKNDWLHRLETKGVTNLPEGSLSDGKSAQEMAQAIRSSSPDFQAAMAIVTLHENTMGNRLSASHARELDKVKHILRNIYKRHDRIKNYEIPKKKGKLPWLKKKRAASFPVEWHDANNTVGYGDMFIELLGKTPEEVAGLTKVSDYHKKMFKHIGEWTEFLKKYFKTNDVSRIKQLMYEHWKDEKYDELPVWDLRDYKPKVVKKEASIQTDLMFASEDKAFKYLADLIGAKVMVAVRKDQPIEKRKLTVADVDPDLAARIHEVVSGYNTRKQQLETVEASVQEKIAKELRAKELLGDIMKGQLKELERLLGSFKKASNEATSVLLDIGDTQVNLEAYVSQRPSYQKALDSFMKDLDDKQRQALKLIIESAHEIKTKLEVVTAEKIASVRVALDADQLRSWWATIVQKLEQAYDWVTGMMTDVSKLQALKNAIAAGQPV
jgi:hypothetical protein